MIQLLGQIFMVFSYEYPTVGSHIHLIRNQIGYCWVPSTYRNCTLRSKSWNLCTSILRNPRSFLPKVERMEYYFSQCTTMHLIQCLVEVVRSNALQVLGCCPGCMVAAVSSWDLLVVETHLYTKIFKCFDDLCEHTKSL